jgi:hypothetical protein
MSEQVKALPARNTASASGKTISWRDYLELTKPRVVALMILTSVIGMLLAAPGVPGWSVLLFGNFGIALRPWSTMWWTRKSISLWPAPANARLPPARLPRWMPSYSRHCWLARVWRS